MLRKVTPWRHFIVGASVAGVTVLVGVGVIGAGDDGVFRPEHFDAKQITVRPQGDDGVRIREVVDIDFGRTERRGYQRIIPDDFGDATAVTASSPTANEELNVSAVGSNTRIRVGNPDITFTGQHRYVVEYTLPEARISSGVLSLDIIGTSETNRTDRFEVVLTGFELEDTTCDTGPFGTFGGCDLVADGEGRYVAVIEPLEPGEGITVGGVITGFVEPAVPAIPAEPDPVPTGWRPLGWLMLVLGGAAAFGVYWACRWYGSNEVVSGGAAEAAFGALPPPQPGEPVADVPTHRVPDARLGELATIEFVPPRGIEPWQGAAVLFERLGDDAVSAWFSEMVAREAITLRENGELLLIEPGSNTARLSEVDQKHLKQLFRYTDSIKLGTYSKSFTSTWKKIGDEQERFVKHSGWWTRGGPSSSRFDAGDLVFLIFPVFVLIGFLANGLEAIGTGVGQFLANPIAALVVGVLFVAVTALLAYRVMLPGRSATGSALALRTESFRRFLEASEGQHVDWAWKHGLLREYSAWAVALGAADAWKRAVESSNIPHPEIALRGPLLVHTSAGEFRTAHTPPSSSGSGGGGGFSAGGGVGGGGGGGSSGSW